MAVIRGIAAAVQLHRVLTPSVDFSLRTFNVYIRSIARALQARYLDYNGERDEGLLIEEILNSRPSANPRVPRDLARIERSLRRAWATERLLRRTYATNADPIMKRDALHWLPSQAYYAIHAALDAVLEAHGLATESHQGALNSFGAAVAQQLPPFPMAAACEGHDGAWKFVGFPVTPVPKPATRVADDEASWCGHLAQGLKTTREDDSIDAINNWKKGNGKKQIPKTERSRIVGKRPKTTVLHLLYRLRRRANYGDVDLFLYEDSKVGDLDTFAAALVWIVSCYVAAFEALVERRIGWNALEVMIRRFPDSASGPAGFVRDRWRMPQQPPGKIP